MCVVSFVGDNFRERIGQDDLWKKFVHPSDPYQPHPQPQQPSLPVTSGFTIDLGLATKAEVDALRREMEQLKKLLEGAIEYDKRNNEPHCEIDEKVALIKKIAEAFGVDLEDVFKK